MADLELVIIFTKPAVPGLVKTRLVPGLTPDQAARFHLAALADTVAVAKQAAGERVALCVAGDDRDVSAFRALYPGRAVWAQRGDELGARLTSAFDDSFAHDVERAIIMGSDHPTLPAEHLLEALQHLRSADVVFGPSTDGGYYAVGVRRGSWPRADAVFQDIPWSTDAVLETSFRRAREVALHVARTPEWYDVDRFDDLDRLRHDAQPDSATARLMRDIQRA